jgi:ectoine hydroxylase-related dioxygenase (phytanoyl-CoA dioxygenase family)
MELTYSQKRELFENGYVKIPKAVPDLMIDEALQTINHSMGEGIPPDQIQIYRSRSYCPEVQSSTAITDLFNKTPAKDLVGSIMDIDRIHPITSGQIALRFPASGSEPRPAHPHLDGMYSPTNGVKAGQISNFTALVCVMLSDVTGDHAGNLSVWPKTHHQYEAYFQEHGAEALLDGMPPIELPEPVQVTGKRGDIVIAHYNLAHGVTPNISPNIRYAVFFRMKHLDINETNWQRPMEDIWMHWPGIQAYRNGRS